MQQGHKPDRYVSFVGIEGDKNSQELIVMLRRHIDDPHKTNRFWDLFREKLARASQTDRNGGSWTNCFWCIPISTSSGNCSSNTTISRHWHCLSGSKLKAAEAEHREKD